MPNQIISSMCFEIPVLSLSKEHIDGIIEIMLEVAEEAQYNDGVFTLHNVVYEAMQTVEEMQGIPSSGGFYLPTKKFCVVSDEPRTFYTRYAADKYSAKVGGSIVLMGNKPRFLT